MAQADWLMVLGGLFLVIGMALLIGGRSEEKGYYDALSRQTDVREFMVHEPERPEPGALKVGGWIALVVGLAMLVIGGAFWLWG